jgi:LPXTG-site transpeptidase (sortase) family protein
MPDVDKGNFILAAHSGSAYISYFNDLYKLSTGDKAYVTYNGVKYTYQIKKIYTQPKTGQIGIYRDHDKTTLTLVTCTNTDKTTQTIYIAELISKN